jgi:hypothetical protein
MSTKTWLSGGKCYLIKDRVVGHYYRKGFPYQVESVNVVGNVLFIYDLLFEGEMPRAITTLRKLHPKFEDYYQDYLQNRRPLVAEEKEYLKTVFKYDIDYFLQLCKRMEAYL